MSENQTAGPPGKEAGSASNSAARQNFRNINRFTDTSPRVDEQEMAGLFIPIIEDGRRYYLPAADIEQINPDKPGSWVRKRDSSYWVFTPLSAVQISAASQPAIPAAPGWRMVKAKLDYETGLYVEDSSLPIVGFRQNGTPIVLRDAHGHWCGPLFGVVAPDGAVYADDGWFFPDVPDWLIGLEDEVPVAA